MNNETRTLIERSKCFETWRDYGATGYAKRFAADAIAEIKRLKAIMDSPLHIVVDNMRAEIDRQDKVIEKLGACTSIHPTATPQDDSYEFFELAARMQYARDNRKPQ